MADLIQIQYEVVDKGKSLKTALTGVERMEKSLAKLSKEIVSGTVTQDRQTKALIAYGRELKRLTGMTGNQAYGAVVKYKNAMVNQTVAQNKAAESAQRLARVQDYLAVRQGRATLAVQNQNAALNQTKNRMNGSNVAIQQLGYQFGDFAVQVQGGTSAFVAFSQQATQLVGILPLVAGPLGLTVGAAVGLSAALGVLIPIGSAVGRMFMEMGGSAESASKDLDALKKAIEDLESATDDVAEAMTFSLEGVFVGATEELQNLLRTYKEMKAEIAKEALAKSLMPLVNNIANLMDELTERKSSRQAVIDVGGDNLPEATKDKIVQEMTAIAEMQVEAAEFLTGIQTALQGPSEKFAENMLKVSRAINNSDTATQSMRDQLLQVLAESGLLAEQKEDAAKKQEEAQKKQEHGLEMIARANAENARLLAQDAAERDAKEKEFQDRLNRTRAIMGQLVAERRAAAKAESEEDRAAAIEAAAKLEIELFNANAAYVKKQKELDAAGDLAILNNQANRELELSRANDAYESLSDAERQKRLDELNDKIQEMAERLAIPFAAALDLIRQAKEEAEIGLDAFGGAGSFKYGGSQKFDGEAAYDANASRKAELSSINDIIAALREQTDQENNLLGLTGERLKEEKIFYDLVQKNAKADIKLSKDKLRAIAKEIAAQQEANEVIQKGIDFAKDLSDTFTDFVMRGFDDFKGFVSSIGNMFKRLLAEMVSRALATNIFMPITAGFTGTMLGSAAGGATGSMISAGAGGGGMLAGIGAAAAGVSSGFMGIMSGGGLSASFANLGGLMSGSVGGLGAIGAAIPAIAAVAVVIGLFTKKTKLLDSGLRTTVEGFDVAIETFKKTQSSRLFGLLKGSKVTAYETASAEVADPLIEGIGNIQQSIVDAADTLGIGANAFDDFSYQFKLSLKGLSEEEALVAIQKEFANISDAMAGLVPRLEEFRIEGETTTKTLARLSSDLSAVNSAFANLGRTALSASIDAAAAASRLVSAAGGQGSFVSKTQTLVSNFLDPSEQLDFYQKKLVQESQFGYVPPEQEVKRIFKSGTMEELETLYGGETIATLNTIFGLQNQIASEEKARQEEAQRKAQAAAQAQAAAAKAAAQAAASRRRMAEAAEQAILDERLGLQKELLELQGNTAELRRLELEALDPTNRALQQMIWKLEDAKEVMDGISEVDFATLFDYQKAVAMARINSPANISAPAMPMVVNGSPTFSSEAIPSDSNEGSTSEEGTFVRQSLVELIKYSKRTSDTLRKFDFDGLPPERT